jgi:hypothetical protein
MKINVMLAGPCFNMRYLMLGQFSIHMMFPILPTCALYHSKLQKIGRLRSICNIHCKFLTHVLKKRVKIIKTRDISEYVDN